MRDNNETILESFVFGLFIRVLPVRWRHQTYRQIYHFCLQRSSISRFFGVFMSPIFIPSFWLALLPVVSLRNMLDPTSIARVPSCLLLIGTIGANIDLQESSNHFYQYHGSSQGKSCDNVLVCVSGENKGIDLSFMDLSIVSLKTVFPFCCSFFIVLSLDFRAIFSNQSNCIRFGFVTRIWSFVFGYEWNYPRLYTSGVYG